MVGLLIGAVARDSFDGAAFVVLGNLRLDQGNFPLGQPVALVEFFVRPFLVQRQIGNEGVHVPRGMLCSLAEGNQESSEPGAQLDFGYYAVAAS